MAKNRVICTINDVDYLSIRKAMVAGTRTIDAKDSCLDLSNIDQKDKNMK